VRRCLLFLLCCGWRASGGSFVLRGSSDHLQRDTLCLPQQPRRIIASSITTTPPTTHGTHDTRHSQGLSLSTFCASTRSAPRRCRSASPTTWQRFGARLCALCGLCARCVCAAACAVGAPLREREHTQLSKT
jgi:ferredoxin